jgi:hypothetical protein
MRVLRIKNLVRTQVGHRDKQEHVFQCPNCGIDISYVLDLDQKNVSWSVREPQNAKWVESEEGAIGVRTFSDELMIPADLQDPWSPFIVTLWNFRDLDVYRHDETLRNMFVKHGWARCERLMVHFENGNFDLFDKEAGPPEQQEAPTVMSRLEALSAYMENAFDGFTRNTKSTYSRVQQRIELGRAVSATLFGDLAQLYRRSGKIAALWRQIRGVRCAMVTNYPALQPLLQVWYWHREHQDLSKFLLSDKRFDALRQFYIDCYETLCRLTAIVVGVEAIIHQRSLGIPTKKGSMTLEEFEAMPNGLKTGIIDKYPIADLFSPVIDNKLRNGIGHNSAHYEPKMDEVICYETKDATTVTKTLPYTEFCDRVLGLFAAFELAERYHHALHTEVGGDLK